jgi:hypothetical protein
MKASIVTLFIALIATTQIHATEYGKFSPINICGERALVVDKRVDLYSSGRGQPTQEHNSYQLVLKNKDIIEYFKSTGAIKETEVNSQGEFLLNLTAEKNSASEFYGVTRGISFTVKLQDGAVALAAYSPSHDGSRLLADFFFTDCR